MITPQLSIMLRTYAAEDPGTWQPVFDLARAADAAGVDRLLLSDHVVFGEHMDAYGRPESGGLSRPANPATVSLPRGAPAPSALGVVAATVTGNRAGHVRWNHLMTRLEVC